MDGQLVNFDLDDTARRIGHLVLRIWQLEEELKRALAPAGEVGIDGHQVREPVNPSPVGKLEK